MSNIRIGQVVLDQFRVDEFIAAGGMGAVYRVYDVHRNVYLALKVLHSDLLEDPLALKRFRREANALKKLAHPNIVQFYGLYEADENLFLLENYIDGPTLKEVLSRKKGLLPDGAVLTIFKALSAALGYAHHYGVVHCDMKPGNVIIDRGGNVFTADFGIARHAESTTTSMFGAGTPAYMAPEQIRGEAVTPATDIYALGCMLFELLTGQRPFTDWAPTTPTKEITSSERLRQAHLQAQPPDLRQAAPWLSQVELAEVVRKAMAKSPVERYASTTELFHALCQAFEVHPDAVSERLFFPDVPPKDNPPLGRGQPQAAPPAAQPKVFRPKGSTILFTSVGVVLIALILFVLTRANSFGASYTPAATGLPTVIVPPTSTQKIPAVETMPNASPLPKSNRSLPTEFIPTKAECLYQVQSGDTFSNIHIRFGLSQIVLSQNPNFYEYYRCNPMEDLNCERFIQSIDAMFPSTWIVIPADTEQCLGNGGQPFTSLPATPGASKTLTPLSTASLLLTATETTPMTSKNAPDKAALVFVSEGEFTMGVTPDQIDEILAMDSEAELRNFSDAPAHTVYLDAYWIYKYEVTNRQYKLCVSAGACSVPKETRLDQSHTNYYNYSAYDNFPVVWVDWSQASRYCQWAGGRLPYEAQWEKAARGTEGRLFPWGDQAPSRSRVNIADYYGGLPIEVGYFDKGASPYGAMEMAGNVYEWVYDWYSAIYYRNSPDRNPKGPDQSASNQKRVVRGGSAGWGIFQAASAFHDNWEPGNSAYNVGFRCVIDSSP